MGDFLYNIGLGKTCPTVTQNPEALKKRHGKDTVNKAKREIKICIKYWYLYYEGLISLIYKELLKIKEKTKIQTGK